MRVDQRAAQTPGISSMALDMGGLLRAVVRSDSSSALAISQRVGIGKVRHIEVPYMWIQEKHAAKQLDLLECRGRATPRRHAHQGEGGGEGGREGFDRC